MTKEQIVEELIELNKSLDSIKIHNLITSIVKDEIKDEEKEGEEEECGPCQMMKELKEAIEALTKGDSSKMDALAAKHSSEISPKLKKKLKKKIAKAFK